MKTIIRLDDFGMSRGINKGIELVIKTIPEVNVSVMTNTNNSIEALEHVKSNKDICFGLHVNLSCGEVLTNTVNNSLVNPHTHTFYPSNVIRALSPEDCYFTESDLYEEIVCQLMKFKKYSKRLPDYLDLHAVNLPIIYDVMQTIAKDYNIRYVEDLNRSDIVFHNIQFNQYEFYSSNVELFFLDSVNLCKDKMNHFVFHPGLVDSELFALSSLTIGRLFDLSVLLSKEFDSWVNKKGIKSLTLDTI